ncbi:MAG: tetratricopeptide repeat protein [Gemmatimonadota bacterium]
MTAAGVAPHPAAAAGRVVPPPPGATGTRVPDPRWGAFALVIALLAIAASATSLGNGFTYDDRWIIAENGRVHSIRALWHYFTESYWPMKSGAALYRPFAIFAYSLQWAVGDGSPLVFHLVNVLLYAASAVAVFWMAGFLMAPGVAWLAAALFAVHPVHVEAVANVVGQAELWAALVVLLAFGLYARDRRDGPLRRETGVGIWFLFIVGLFTKEHVIVLPALLVAAEVLLYRDTSLWQRLRRLRLLLWPMLVVVIAYLMIRVRVIGGIGGDVEHPSLHNQAMFERLLIMLNVFPEYGRLLLWPARLFADYSPRHLMVYATPHSSQLSGVLLVLCVGVLFGLSVRRMQVVAFAICWLCLALAPVTNILLPTGILLAERTLFLPSVGAMLVVAASASLLRERLSADGSPLQRLVPVISVVLLALGVLRSSSRNPFWHDTPSAFARMVEDAPLNFKAHWALGGQLFEEGRNKEAEIEWRLSIALLPDHFGVYVDLAHKYREMHLCQAAIELYRKALILESNLPVAHVSIAACQLELAQWRAARTTSRIAIANGYYRRAFTYMIDRADSALVAQDTIDPTIGAKWRDRRRPAPKNEGSRVTPSTLGVYEK